MTPRQFAAQHCAHGAVDVANGRFDEHAFAPQQRRLSLRDQIVVQRRLQAVVLRGHAMSRHGGIHVRAVKDRREVQTLRLPVVNGPPHIQQIAAPHHLFQRAKP